MMTDKNNKVDRFSFATSSQCFKIPGEKDLISTRTMVYSNNR